MDTRDLTPVERIGDYWFKREDLYKPYAFSPANGSKLRQCQLLVAKNMDKARNGVITGTSILSPQAVIIASVAKDMGVPCTIYYGGTREDLLPERKYPSLAMSLGADVSIVSKLAYTSVLTARAEEKALTDGLFHVRYGFDLRSNLDVFVESVARQVENIPSEVHNIVITVGSAITLVGLLYGLATYETNIERIYAIGCAPNRINTIQDYADMIWYERGVLLPAHLIRYVDAFNTMKGYKYENTMRESYHGLEFHPRYEAKTFHWLRSNPLPDCLMWVTGQDF